MNGGDGLAAILARALSFAPAIGVTRLAVLTGLDVIGIPVAAAVRPNSRTVAVHQGKGASLEAAKVSALMEAAECFCAEMLDLPLRLGSMEELGGPPMTLDVTRLPRCPGGDAPEAARLLWVEGRSLFSGRPVWVPRELVAADFILPLAPGSGVFQATTNGMGAGSTEPGATLHALCEVIERDAMALWFGASAVTQRTTLVDPASVDGPLSLALLCRCAAAGAAVTIWDVTSDIGLPVYAALLVDPSGQVQPELGSACRPGADAALAAALAEAAQARVTTISGARDDLTPASFSAAAMRARAEAAAAWRGAVPRRAFGGSTEAASETVLRHLHAAGLAEAAVVRLTRPELGVPVVRVVVPGLEGPWGEPGGEYVPGARAVARR